MPATPSASTILTPSRSRTGTQNLNQKRYLRQIPEGLLQQLVLWPEPLWQPQLLLALAKRRPKRTATKRLKQEQGLLLRQRQAEVSHGSEKPGAQLEAHLQLTPRQTPIPTHRLRPQGQPQVQQQLLSQKL